MMIGTNATGRRCMQCSHTTQHHGESWRSGSKVGAGGVGFMPARIPIFAPDRDVWLYEAARQI
jgi:hypothetical protein